MEAEGVTTIHLGPNTSTGSSSSTVTDTAITMTINEHVGRILTMLTGPNAGATRLIKSNTATVLTVNTPFIPQGGPQDYKVESTEYLNTIKFGGPIINPL